MKQKDGFSKHLFHSHKVCWTLLYSPEIKKKQFYQFVCGHEVGRVELIVSLHDFRNERTSLKVCRAKMLDNLNCVCSLGVLSFITFNCNIQMEDVYTIDK